MTTYEAVDVGSSVTSALTSIANFIPKLVLFLVILLVGWIIARVLRGILAKVLTRVGFDRVAERGGIQRYLGRQTASTLVAMLVYYAVLLFALQLGFGAFGPNPVSNLISGVVNFLPKAFVAIVIVIIAAAIARVVHDLVVNALGGLSYGNALGRIAQAFILAMGVIAALNQIQVATSVIEPVFIAVLAIIVGVAIVGIGGGLVGPMRERWERMLTRAESEAGSVQESIRSRSAQHDVQPGRAAQQPGQYPAGQQPQMQGMPQGMPQHAAPPPQAGQQMPGHPGMQPPPTDPGYGQRR
jgi:mechanosensitive ion channel-like protein